MATKTEFVLEMEAAAFAGDWEKFKSHLTDDVYVRVGNTAEVRGPQAVADFMIEMLRSRLAINDLKKRGSWENPDSVIVEFDVKALRVLDQRNVTFPCLDIYRFQNGKINDWRVFAIEPTHIV